MDSHCASPVEMSSLHRAGIWDDGLTLNADTPCIEQGFGVGGLALIKVAWIDVHMNLVFLNPLSIFLGH